MIVIRPIVRSEAPAFLALLCKVFELDYSRAESIFFGEPFFDLDRKWALFDGDQIVSILTTVPLNFGLGRAFGIAGVATDPIRRGEGLGKRLLNAVLRHGEEHGEPRALLFAHQVGLYERCGFKVLDHAIRAPIQPRSVDDEAPIMAFDDVVASYTRWSQAAPHRLLRDERRWNFWKWNLRICSEVPGGYVCQEGDTVRECLFDIPLEAWPVYPNAEWFGLESLADELQIPLGPRKRELIYMGIGFVEPPKMFMTDQF